MLDENVKRYLTDAKNEDDACNNLELWLYAPRLQGRDEGHHELPMSNLWALPVDGHAPELIYHCKLCLFQVCSGHCLPVHPQLL